MALNYYNKNETKKLALKNSKNVNTEKLVDKILLENKKKFNESNKKELDLEKISLKNKTGNTIYYLRKRPKEIEELDEIKEPEKKFNNSEKNNNQLNSKNFDIVLLELEKELDKIQLKMTNENKKMVLKKFIENSKTDKKPSLFFKNEKFKDEKKKEFDKFSPRTDGLDEFKKQESKKITPPRITDEKEKIISQENLAKIKSKRPFFKPENSSEIKLKDVEQKTSFVKTISLDNEFNKGFIKIQDKEKLDEKPVKKSHLFFKHKRLKERKEEDSDWLSSITEDLIESKYNVLEKISPVKVFDKKDKTIKKEKEKEEDVLVGSEIRRPFFKSKTLSEFKSKVVEEKTPLVEKVTFDDKLDKIFIESKKKERLDFKPAKVDFGVKADKILQEHIESRTDIGTFGEKPVKKSRLFFKHKRLKDRREEDLVRPLSISDDLDKSKVGVTEEILPHKIVDEKEKPIIGKGLFGSKKRRPFFKSKTLSEVESGVIAEKTPLVERISFGDEVDKEDAKLIDKKIVESKEKSDDSAIKAELEIKAKKLAYEHLKKEPIISSFGEKPVKKSRLFFKHKRLKDRREEDLVRPLSISDDLDKSKVGVTEEILPHKIVDEKEKPIIGKGLFGSKKRRPFFKSKKMSEVESGVVEGKTTTVDSTNIKSIFNVERISFGDEVDKEDAKLIDKKIVESKEKSDDSPIKAELEIKANKLAEEHLKNGSPKNSLNKEFDKKLESNLNINLSSDSKVLDHEHVFFNEEDTPHYGWSPQIGEKEKNKEPENISPEGEIGVDNLEKVNDIEIPRNILTTSTVKLTELGFSENEWDELDFYALYEPFVYVEILRQKDTLDKCYFLVEMALTEEEKNILAFLKDTLNSFSINTEEMEDKGEDEYLYYIINQILKEYNIKIKDESKKKLFYYIGKSSLGLGKINPLMKDPNIEDISCDGARVPVFLYHRKYGSLKSNVRFEDEDELSSFIFKLAQKCGKHISIAEPMLDATMPDGSRIQMTLSDEITAKGSTFTIRKFRADPFSPTDLIEFNTMSSEMIAYMWVAVENGINTLFAGGTASGKTTTLNAVMLFIPRESKIVSIEETREINLPHPNWIPGVSRTGFGEIVADKVVGEIDTYDLMKAALRQRPEYIIVGEIRGKEAYVLFQAMATGHATYSTAHADSAQSLIHRLEGKPINIPRIMLQSLDLVCIHVITKVKNMRARRCKQIIEIIDIDPTTKEILTNEVFHWDPVEDKFKYSGKSYILERIRTEKDLTKEEMNQEIADRKKIIDWMNANNIRGFKDVANIVTKYTETPDELLKKIGKVDN